jgi:hypothetical protein
MTTAHKDIAHHLIQSQDDSDTVVLPNACKGQIIQFTDGAKVRCFSVLVREPHMVPQESWSMITVPAMPAIDTVDGLVLDKIMVDHVTRGFIGDNAMQFTFGKDSGLDAVRLLPPGDGPAQQQWEAQTKKMIG